MSASSWQKGAERGAQGAGFGGNVLLRPLGRCALSLFLIVEGPSDKDALTLLIKKIRSVTIVCKPVRSSGDLRNARKLAAHIREQIRNVKGISKILICIDSECTDPEETRKSILPAENELRRSFPSQKPTYVVVDHSLEGWLACDKEALKVVLGPQAKLPRSNPEDSCRPAKLMDDIFTQNGRDGYEKTRHATPLAKACHPKNIAAKSQTFQYFQQAILDP